MNLPSKVLVYVLFFISAVVVSELALLFFLGDQGKIILNSLIIQKSEKSKVSAPSVAISSEAAASCSNWFSKYKNIDSSETTTSGTFSHMEENPKTNETKIFFTGKQGAYYVSFDSKITVVTVVDREGKKLQKSSLKKGDYLSVVEKYLKRNDDSENFSVIITRQ